MSSSDTTKIMRIPTRTRMRRGGKEKLSVSVMVHIPFDVLLKSNSLEELDEWCYKTSLSLQGLEE